MVRRTQANLRLWADVPAFELPEHIQHLIVGVPGRVILQSHEEAFQEALDGSWAQQNREIVPACIVRPNDVHELSKVVKILKEEHDRRRRVRSSTPGFFSIRSGGLNPGLGASVVENGVVVDLGSFCEVEPALDGATVTVGTGAKWGDVYKLLDGKGLTVMGGRSSPVGVGGLTLQGGISFYSPRFGFVCSNVMSFEVVLGDGIIVTATASEHSDLWRALKGGSNNFGIVTRFTLRSLPAEPLWSVLALAPAAFQHGKALAAYHDYIEHASSGQPGAFDENAAGPILTFGYVQRIGVRLMGFNLVYTKAPDDRKWPPHWKQTGFSSIWTLYRSAKVRTHSNAVEIFGRTAPAGTRHVQGTTTLRNNAEAMKAAYAIFCRTISSLRPVRGLFFPITFQAILPGWMNKGCPNVFGLEECKEPLIILNCSVTWGDIKDDELMRSTVRKFLEEIEEDAGGRQASHPFRFMNYAMEWQRPYRGYGETNMNFLRETSLKYDPSGLFQNGCSGGFKLDFMTP